LVQAERPLLAVPPAESPSTMKSSFRVYSLLWGGVSLSDKMISCLAFWCPGFFFGFAGGDAGVLGVDAFLNEVDGEFLYFLR
jgi:hypothetical protein